MKKLLIPLTVVLYVMQIVIVVGVICEFRLPSFQGRYFAFAALALGIVSFVLCMINIGFGLAVGLRGRDCTLTVAIIKTVLAPYFIINFVLCFLLVAGFLNPFLMWSLVIVIPLMIFFTYVVLLATSAYDIGYSISRIRKKKDSVSNSALYIVLLFVYVLDIVSAVILAVRSIHELRELRANGFQENK